MLTCVEQIHENSIVHPDLKPANFLIVRGRMEVIDFGISTMFKYGQTSLIKSEVIGMTFLKFLYDFFLILYYFCLIETFDFMAPEKVTKIDLDG